MSTSFGIATAPQQVTYEDVRRVWREADEIPGRTLMRDGTWLS